MKMRLRILFFAGLSIPCTVAWAGTAAGQPGEGINSDSTKQPSYSSSVRTSQYVTVRDGTRLAIDIYRPTENGQPVEKKLPVILVATPYHRSSENNGEILTFLAPQSNHLNIF